MAQPTTLSFSNFKVLIEHTAGSGTYTAPCAFTSRSLTLSADLVDTTVPDCDDPDAAVYVERQASTLSAQVQGQGLLAMADLDEWRAFVGQTKNCRVQFNASGANNGGYYQGAFILSSLELGAERNQKTTISITLSSTGALTWTAAA